VGKKKIRDSLIYKLWNVIRLLSILKGLFSSFQEPSSPKREREREGKSRVGLILGQKFQQTGKKIGQPTWKNSHIALWASLPFGKIAKLYTSNVDFMILQRSTWQNSQIVH
jgi:hypothetical protein